MASAIDVIKSNVLFRTFGDEILQALNVCGKDKSFAAGEVLINEGSQGEEIFLIIDGKACVRCASNRPSEPSEIVMLGAGEIIGEMSMVEQMPRSASVIAETDVQTKVWTASSWRSLCEDYPKFGYELMTNIAALLCQRLRRTNSNVAVLNKVLWGDDSTQE